MIKSFAAIALFLGLSTLIPSTADAHRRDVTGAYKFIGSAKPLKNSTRGTIKVMRKKIIISVGGVSKTFITLNKPIKQPRRYDQTWPTYQSKGKGLVKSFLGSPKIEYNAKVVLSNFIFTGTWRGKCVIRLTTIGVDPPGTIQLNGKVKQK